MRGCLVLLVALCAAPPALAQPVDEDALRDIAGEQPEDVSADTELGPVVTIEAITIHGNTATQEEIIRRALPITAGDVLKQSDRRLRDVRFKLLALGFFRDVQVAMRKGTARGSVIVDVVVAERGTFVLDRLWFGHTDFAPYWLGIDVGDRNLLGLGIAGGVGLIYAAPGTLDGSEAQWAGEVRLAADSLRGTRWGAHGSLTLVNGNDFYFVDPAQLQQGFTYRRFTGRFGATYDLTALSRLSSQVRLESISHDITPGLERELWLSPGDSRVITLGLGFDHDTRSDPVLPHNGSRLAAIVEVGLSPLASDYDFATAFARYEYWLPLRSGRHAIGVRLEGGAVLGDAPRFDRIYISDVNRMLTPRALGLVLSDAEPVSFLGTREHKPTIGQAGGLATVEYAVQLFRGKGERRVYGGDVFVGLGVWGLRPFSGDRRHRVLADEAGQLSLDLYADIGLRIDTELGIFELTVANALGRLR